MKANLKTSSFFCKMGFSICELVVFIAIIGILASVSIPVFSNWIPEYRLKTRANELYGDMHLTKMRAIKENKKYKIIFSTEGNPSYSLVSSDGSIEKTVELSPERKDEICFGCGGATKSATKSGSTPPSDGVSFNNNQVTFNPRGTGSTGYVYLNNKNGNSYAIGTLSSGVIFIKKWDKTSSKWK